MNGVKELTHLWYGTLLTRQYTVEIMITFLSGGTGTPKLLQGMREHLPDTEISVVVNTAEDIWMSGNHVSPDIDTILYLYAGILDITRWWGIHGDTFLTHEVLKDLGGKEFIAIGDRDRATHILRGELLKQGMSLTECTSELCRLFHIQATVLPMSDLPVSTMVETTQGTMHFQEFWVKERGLPRVQRVYRTSVNPPAATAEVLCAIRESDVVVIGPSNPITSIMPILECSGVTAALSKQRVIAVSPFIGHQPISGPAGVLMEAWGVEPNSRGTYHLYQDVVNVFIQDIRDDIEVPGALKFDTVMRDSGKSAALAKYIIEIIDNLDLFS